MVMGVDDGSLRRLTTDAAELEGLSVWSPDGRRVAFRSDKANIGSLYAKAIETGEAATLLLNGDNPINPSDWTRDDRYIVYTVRNDIWALPLTGDRNPVRLTSTSFGEFNPRVSRDSHWVAYSSNETGRSEVFVQSFPKTSVKYQVSTNGGQSPVWSPDGTELYYIAPNDLLMAVSFRSNGGSAIIGSPSSLFHATFTASTGWNYDVSPDGRFLVNISEDEIAIPITVIVNWAETLK